MAAARQSGDRSREATALADLGVTQLSEGKRGRRHRLARGGACDRPRAWRPPSESTTSWAIWDWHYWGLASLRGRVRSLSRGWDTPDPAAITWARKRRWSGWGSLTGIYVSIRLRSPASSRPCPWRGWWATGCRRAICSGIMSIQHAEMGQRDLAIAKAEESIALFKAMGRPQAAWYGSHLQKYRMGLYEEAPAASSSGVSVSPQSYLGGAIVASVMPGQQQSQAASQPNSGPGLLRMAMSATKAMATFVGSGMKTTPADLQQKRIQTCGACEHHTGMRCKVCGCFTHVKTKMLHEDCPIGKWPG